MFRYKHVPLAFCLLLLPSFVLGAEKNDQAAMQPPQEAPDLPFQESSYSWTPSVTMVSGGTALRAGRQLFFLEGLTSDQVGWIRNSFIYGGILPALLKHAANYGYDHYIEGTPHAPWVRSVVTLGYMGHRAFYGIYAAKNLLYLWESGLWHMLPAMASFIPGTFPYPYLTMAGLAGLGSLYNSARQLSSETNTQSIHVPISGECSKHFVVKALFPENPDENAKYELNRITQGSNETDVDEYQSLSQVLEQLNIDRIYIEPEHVHGKNIVTSYFHDPELEQTITIVLQDGFGYHSDAPWLLNALFHKADRNQIEKIYSAISPSVIQALANAYRAYEYRDHCKTNSSQTSCSALKETAPDTYYYQPEQPLLALSYQSVIESRQTIFHFGSSRGEADTHITWSDGTIWPSLKVAPQKELPEDALSQWVIPQWVSDFLTAELATQAREQGYSFTDKAAGKFVSITPEAPLHRENRERRERREREESAIPRWQESLTADILHRGRTGPAGEGPITFTKATIPKGPPAEDWTCAICLLSGAANRITLPCEHTFCRDCIKQCARTRGAVSRNAPGYNMLCPNCRAVTHFRDR